MTMRVKKWYEQRHGSAKGYYIMLMEASVLSCLLVSAASNFLPGLYSLNVLPAAGLALSLYHFGREYKKEFLSHAIVFAGLFLFALYAPWLMKSLAARLSREPLSAARETAVGAVVVLLVFAVLRTVFRKKTVEGKVIMADKENAVVRIDYDIFAGIKAGEYVVKNNGARKGDTVTVELETSFIKGVKPSRIVMKPSRRNRRAGKRKKGLVSIDAIAAIVLLLMILVAVQNYATSMNKQAKEYGTAIQAKAASIGMGSRMNALKALGLGPADYYNARSKVPVISVSPTEYEEAKITKNKGENDVHTLFGEYEFTYPAPLDYYYYNGCIASNPAVMQSACKTSLPQCTVKFRHCSSKGYLEPGNTFSIRDNEQQELLTSYVLKPKQVEYSGHIFDSVDTITLDELRTYFDDAGFVPPDFFPSDYYSQEYANLYALCLDSLGGPGNTQGIEVAHVYKGKEGTPYANTYTISCGYNNRQAGPLTGGTQYLCGEDPRTYNGYCFPLYTIGGDCDIRPEPNLNYYPEKEVCE